MTHGVITNVNDALDLLDPSNGTLDVVNRMRGITAPSGYAGAANVINLARERITLVDTGRPGHERVRSENLAKFDLTASGHNCRRARDTGSPHFTRPTQATQKGSSCKC